MLATGGEDEHRAKSAKVAASCGFGPVSPDRCQWRHRLARGPSWDTWSHKFISHETFNTVIADPFAIIARGYLLVGVVALLLSSAQCSEECSSSSITAMGGVDKATFAAGCFWGVENYFLKQFKDAIKASAVGYTGGKRDDPSYQQVCAGSTGHAEAFQMEYDSSKASYKELVSSLLCHAPVLPVLFSCRRSPPLLSC